MALNINGTTGISGVDGSASAPAVTGTDSNTGINFGSDILGFNTGGVERSRFDANGNLLIGTTSFNNGNFTGSGHGITIGGTAPQITLHQTGSNTDSFFGNNGTNTYLYTADSMNMVFGTSDAERMRLDSSGNLGLGTSSPNSLLNIRKSSHYVATNNGKSDHLHITGAYGNSGELSGSISFGVTSSTSSSGAAIAARQYSSTAHQLGLSFFTHPTTTESDDSVEHLRLLANGKLATAYQTSHLSDYAQLDVVSDEGTGGAIRAFMDVNSTAVGYSCLELRHQGARSGQDAYGARFKNSGGHVCGSILLGQSTTAYNTSSDYRLKENVVPISDGITRLKTLKPYRFNWIEEKGQPKVDGFFAHEVTAVPEAVKGTKDAVETTYYDASDTLPKGKSIGDVKDEASPVYQQIDQSKLVPLLTAALQEAVAKIEVLETKVAALEAA